MALKVTYITNICHLFEKKQNLVIVKRFSKNDKGFGPVPLTPCRLKIPDFQNCDLNIHYWSNPGKKCYFSMRLKMVF